MDNRNIMVQGETVTIRQPFTEGHTCTAGEAKALNQLLAENVRNNTAKLVKDAKEKNEDLTPILAKITDYAAEYEFTVGSVGSGRQTLDPVEREAKKIATAALTAHLKKTSRTKKDVSEEAWNENLETLMQRDDVVKAARKAVADRKKLEDALLSGADEIKA